MANIDSILMEEILLRNLVSKEKLELISKEKTGNLKEILIKNNILSEEKILDILSKKFKLEILDLNNISIDKSLANKIPFRVASYYKFVPIEIKDKLIIAVDYPLDIKTIDEIRTQIGFDINIVLAKKKDIKEALKKLYGLGATEIDTEKSSTFKKLENIEDIEVSTVDSSIINLVNQIILDAYKKRATDIHIEPYRDKVLFRYRIDGMLYEADVDPNVRNFLPSIISRIKIMANLNIVERRLPQDGRAIVKIQDEVLDLRVSTIPVQFGESIVIRILPTKMLFSLEKLGLDKEDLEKFQKLLKLPYGIIFVTGPTGSGKTTTLYACLNSINTPDKKIITIEDPIEYEMDNITQIQVFPEIGLTFARGLRHILRHDPDVIMVGEVRDLETAEIAIRIALTGHLVFSTLHTNDSASGITRLIDIGVEPYLVASSVQAFVAQRLIRLICQNCKLEDKDAPIKLKELIKEELNLKSIDEVKIFKSKGCKLCNFTGFFGRIGIYEILIMDDKIKDLVLEKAPSNYIKKIAILNGLTTLRQDGWRKVISGLTVPTEIIRVTSAGEEEFDFALIDNLESHKKEFFVSKKTEENLNERRLYPRVKEGINISYRVVKSEELVNIKEKEYSVSKDISAGGLLFVVDKEILVGSILELTIEVPDGGEPIKCLAKVVRVEEIEYKKTYNCAVCFLDLAGAERNRLNKFILDKLILDK